MAKETGLGWTTLSVDNAAGTPVDIRNDIGSLQFATPRGVQDVTGIDKSAYERLLLLADFSITLTMPAFDDATASTHTVFKTVPSTSIARTVSIGVSGQTLACETLFTDYSHTRAQDGSFGSTAPGVLADGATPTWS